MLNWRNPPELLSPLSKETKPPTVGDVSKKHIVGINTEIKIKAERRLCIERLPDTLAIFKAILSPLYLIALLKKCFVIKDEPWVRWPTIAGMRTEVSRSTKLLLILR